MAQVPAVVSTKSLTVVKSTEMALLSERIQMGEGVVWVKSLWPPRAPLCPSAAADKQQPAVG